MTNLALRLSLLAVALIHPNPRKWCDEVFEKHFKRVTMRMYVDGTVIRARIEEQVDEQMRRLTEALNRQR